MTGGRETLIDYAAAAQRPPPSRCVGLAHDEKLPRLLLRPPVGCALPPVRQRRNEAELRRTFGDWFFSVVVREVEECQESPQRMQGLSGQTLSLSCSPTRFFPAWLHCLPLCFPHSGRRRAANRLRKKRNPAVNAHVRQNTGRLLCNTSDADIDANDAR